LGIPEIVSLIKDILSIFSGIILTIIAFLGLQAWKKQLKGNTEYNLARRFLRSVYKIRNAIDYIRNPFITSGETASAIHESNIVIDKSDPDNRVTSQNAVYQQRWNKIQEALSEFNVELFEAEVLWGKEIRRVVKPLGVCISELQLEIQRMLRRLQREFQEEIDEDEERRRNDIIYSFESLMSEDSENHFSKEIIKSIHDIEEFIKPLLKL
jgi:hypothetical protein